MRKILCVLLIVALLISCCGCRLIDELQNILQPEIVEEEWEDAAAVDPVTAEEIHRNYYRQFERLNEQQQYIYRVLYAAANQMIEGWFRLDVNSKNNSRDIALAFQALSNDHPEMFWLPYNYLLRKTNSATQFAFSYQKNGRDYDYLISAEERDGMCRALEKKAAEILAECPEDPFKAEVYLHDRLCKIITYDDHSDNSMVYTAYGALVEGKAVCEGYARAMQYLCQRSGIPCTLVIGEYGGEGHMWNLIQLDDEWYHLDITWDDSDDISRYYFFNLTDKEIMQDHTISPLAENVDTAALKIGKNNLFKPTCTTTRFNYYVYYDLLVTRKDPTHIAKRIAEAQRHGKSELQFRFTDKAYLRAFKEDAQSAVDPIQKALSKLHAADAVNNIMTVDNYVTFLWK